MVSKTKNAPRADLLLVCSTGGHLLQLHALQDAWEPFSRIWVTNNRSDAESLLRDELVVYGYWPTIRNVRNLVRNTLLAFRLVRRVRPTVILTTGAAIAVPFAWIGWAFGAKVVYVESFTRVDSVSLSCRLIKPIADRLYVQWPELRARLPEARYAGTVLAR
jgi:UDP-N-acetylglucosamine:LPS N-acetylglucosamine transferase